jgi:MoaA/NifB/PqqE/SkfB family radical SAM enzyme
MRLLDQVSEIAGRLASRETLKRAVTNIALPEREKLPLVMCFYLTYGCNAACEFCSQGRQVYGAERGRFRDAESDAEAQLQILRIVREEVPNIYFLGGEPTVSPHLPEMLKESRRLEFENIAVNTNCLIFCPEILEYADALILSLHCDDDEKAQQIYRISPERAGRIYENVLRYLTEKKRHMTVVVNCVVRGNSIDDAYDVAELARKLCVHLNIAPAIGMDGRPDPGLIDNPQYRELIEWAARQQGFCASSARGLEIIKTFEPFACNPHVTPGVHPNGDLIVPCANLPEGYEAVNILETGSVKSALRIGREMWEAKHGILDTQRRCREMCHKTCYVETSALGTISGVRDVIRAQFEMWRRQRNTPFNEPSPKELRSGKSPNQQRTDAEIDALPIRELDGPCPCCNPGAGMFG